MPPILTTAFKPALAAAVVGLLLPMALAHGGDEGMNMTMDMANGLPVAIDQSAPEPEQPASYFRHPEQRSLLIAHIALMVLGWVFVLPIATMFSLARSRYTLPTQLLFLATNALGVLFSTVYNANTPDLYPNNAHHKLGWLVTWILSAQVVVGLLGRLAGAFSRKKSDDKDEQRQSLIPVTRAAMAQFHDSHQYSPIYRHSNDSGQGTEPNTESLRGSSSSFSVPASPTAEDQHHKELAAEECDDEELEMEMLAAPAPDNALHNFAAKVGAMIPSPTWKVLTYGYNFVDRTSLILGFITLATAVVTLGRFFEGSQIFTGLAHWIKGGVFFWLGILNLARWAGCFGDVGWAWNIRPHSANTKRWVPTAEFAESFLIFFYGGTNIFLEHLGSSDGEWSFEDLEHISITVLFLGGGLCGMLIESRRIRDLLNTTTALAAEKGPAHLEEPPQYGFSLNPLPALVIMLTGIMMSSHTQQSMISSMIHKQWGTMLSGAAIARALTYVLVYLKPPTSTLPSRPPTELLSAFGLMTGGVLFMASSGDTVSAMERNGVDEMFMYTVTMGLVGLVMAWEIVCVAVKGWAVRREMEMGERGALSVV